MAVLYGKPVRDSQSGMWIFRRAVYPKLRVTSDGMAFSAERSWKRAAAKRVPSCPLDRRFHATQTPHRARERSET